MTWIEATCPDCGSVQCAPEEFTLALCTTASASYYAFRCPSCASPVQKNADDRIAEILIAEGVTATSWELPAELLEAHDGPAFTFDDILDLHLALERENWIEHLSDAIAS